MNMKEAKVQLKQTIQAYLARDAFGNLAIPQVAQRPLLLMGPRASARPPSPTRPPRSAASASWPTP